MPTPPKTISARHAPEAWPAATRRSLRRWLAHWHRRRAGVDPATGLPTDRSVVELAELKRQAPPGPHGPLAPMSVLRCALDDRAAPIGSAAPHVDSLQRLVTQALQAGLRQGDLLGRCDGGFFIVVLPASDASAARMVGERLRALVEACALRSGPQGPLQPVSISIGVSAVQMREPLIAAVARANGALAEARSAGRNRVHVARSMA